MAEIEIGDALASGFGLIRREPIAVLLWGLLYMAAAAVAIALFGPVYAAFLTTAISQSAAGATPDPSVFMRQIFHMEGVGLLASFGLRIVGVVIYCAVFRAVLHPDQRRFGYMRIGMAELFVFILIFAAGMVIGFGIVIPILVIGLIVAVLVAMKAVAAAVIVGVLGAVALIFALIYVALRFSLVGPMIVDDGKFHLFESWNATKGRTVSLFTIGISLMMIFVVAEMVVGAVLVLIGMGALGSAAGGLDHLQAFFHSPPQLILSKLAPALVVFAVVWTLLTGCAVAVFGAPWARAYRDIAGPDVPAQFA